MKIKKLHSSISVFMASLLMVISIGLNVAAYSGVLDEYSGSCGYGGQASIDSFYNDDGTFYVYHTINYKSEYEGSMGISARKSVWNGWSSQQTFIKSSKDSSMYTYNVPKGKYKMYFYTTSDYNYVKFDFEGTVYDTN